MRSVLMTLAMFLVVSITGAAAADCPADLDGSGDVGFADLTTLLAAWGPEDGCIHDLNGDGKCGFADLTTLLAAWGECPGYPCPDDLPAYYDPAPVHDQTSIEWVANGVCNEYLAVTGSSDLACDQAQTSGFLADINTIVDSYDFTGAVFDAQTGGGQSYRHSPDILLCGSTGGPFPDGFYDDIAACWHGAPQTPGSLVISFDWNVNVNAALDAYEAYVLQNDPGGFCELDGLFGAPSGFHASDAGSGWTSWTVYASNGCDFGGCNCYATLTGFTDPDGNFHLSGIQNDSNPSCTDSRFIGI